MQRDAAGIAFEGQIRVAGKFSGAGCEVVKFQGGAARVKLAWIVGAKQGCRYFANGLSHANANSDLQTA
jgi:hypothetical protein